MIRFLLFGDPATRAPLPPTRGRSLRRASLAAAALFLVASSSFGQSGGNYELNGSTIDGGGATFSTGGSYRVGGTVGQPDADTQSASAFVLNGGFWGGISLVPCEGDCDGGGTVTVDELIIGVNIALEAAPVSACESFDTNGSGTVTVDELVTAVDNALTGCPQ